MNMQNSNIAKTRGFGINIIEPIRLSMRLTRNDENIDGLWSLFDLEYQYCRGILNGNTLVSHKYHQLTFAFNFR